MLSSVNFIRFPCDLHMLFSFTKENAFGLKKKNLQKDANLLSQTRVPMIFAIILGPRDLGKLPLEDCIP